MIHAGKNWKISSSGLSGAQRVLSVAIHPGDVNVVFVSDSAGAIFKSTNGGKSWQKKLQKGERIPDDVWAHRVPVPREIKLGDTPAGAINVRINDKIVRVAERTREVLDILSLPGEVQRSGPPR